MRIEFLSRSLMSNRRNRLAYIDNSPTGQRGVVLMIALIVLVVMTIAGIALVRSVDTGNLVAGNLAFKQGATLAGDVGTETAVSWLVLKGNGSGLYQNDSTKGYYATSLTELDPTNASSSTTLPAVDWDGNNCAGIPNNGQCFQPVPSTTIDNDNTVSYLITRLCQIAGDPNATGNTCVTYQASDSTSPKKGEIKYGEDKRFEPLPSPYYRIVSRIKGPRNTVSFVETIVHF